MKILFKTRRKSLAFLMVVLMLAQIVPVFNTPVRAADNQNQTDAIFNLDKSKPTGFNKMDDVDPYGSVGNTPFLISEQNELFGYWGHHKAVYGMTFNNLDMTRQKYDGSYAVVKSPNRVASNGSFSNMDEIGFGEDAYRFVRGTSFDPMGSGRRDYAAYIGWDPTCSTYVCFVRKPGAKTIYTIYLDEANWINTTKPYYYEMISKVAITTGDYDGDGKDSLIVYGCGDGSNVNLYEIKFNGTALTSKKILDLNTVLVDKGYTTESHEKYKPIVTLTTGDFDGDETEEFAYSAGFHNDSDSKEDGWNEDFTDIRKYTTCIGIGDYSNGWKMNTPIWMYDKGETQHQDDLEVTLYTLMHGGTIAAGNIDGEGADEIVVVGYTSNQSATAKANNIPIRMIGACDVNKTQYVTATIRYKDNAYVRSGLSLLDMSTFVKKSMDRIKDKRNIWMPITVACGRTNGHSTPADVFISGQIYSYKAGSAENVFTPEIMTETFNTILDDGTTTDVYWVNDVAVGNFNHNDAGREQFVYTLWFKKKDARTTNVYMGVMGGSSFGDTKDGSGNITYGSCTEYAASDIRGDYSGWVDEDKTESASKVIKERDDTYCNTVFVPVDVNNDGVLARRSMSNGNNNYVGYAYTDPEVLAVLQAGPYFKEVDDIGGYADSCGTEFSIETSTGYSNSKGDNVSFGVGFAGEVQAGPVKTSVESGYTMDWSQSFEEEFEQTHSSTFSAQEEDQVVLSRIPEMIYCYDIYKDGKWVQNAHTIRVSLAPVYFQMGIDEYNEFVDQYNTRVGETLYKITDKDLPSDNEGNPYKYRNIEWSNSEPQLSAGQYQLGYSGGAAIGAWSSSASSTLSREMSHGFTFSLTVQGGGSLAGSVEGWAGGYVNLDYSKSTGNSTSKGSTKSAAGQVQNISASAVNGIVSNQLIKSYGFDWSFGSWSKVLQKGKAAIPFYGYRVTNIKAPAPTVDDFEMALITDEEHDPALKFTWSNPATKERPVTEFVLYYVDEDGDSEEVAVLPATTLSYQLKAEGNYRHKYMIAAKGTSGNGIEGIPSEKAGLKPSQKTQAEAAITQMKADKAAANNVMELIQNLPEAGAVTEENREAIEAARTAYNSLSEEQKARISTTSFQKLTQVESAISNIPVVQKYNVVFEDGQGKVIKTESVEKGTSATAPENLKREGFVFDGWDVDFSNVQSDLTVTAKWMQETVSSPTPTTTPSSTPTTKPSPTPIKTPDVTTSPEDPEEPEDTEEPEDPEDPEEPETISIQDAKVILSETSFVYNAKVQKPEIESIDDQELTEGE
ncbi:MAG: InlB B-repeat-containing protein, partial [Lachnospiraceae bacterium]|nr:InlB B-repeat-containing protein [Lachnospiraceae bacterium]